MAIVARTKAFRYEMVSRVSIWSYLAIPISLVFDISMFNTEFTMGQVIGIIIIFGAVIVNAVNNYGRQRGGGAGSPRKA